MCSCSSPLFILANCFQKAKTITIMQNTDANSPENSNQICELVDSDVPRRPSPRGGSELLLSMKKIWEYFQRYSKYFVYPRP